MYGKHFESIKFGVNVFADVSTFRRSSSVDMAEQIGIKFA